VPIKHTNPAGKKGKPITLAPLTFDEALVGLLQVKPESSAIPTNKTTAKQKPKRGK
jgi:hypothetical protein